MKITAPQIRKKVRALQFGEAVFLTTKKQVKIADDEAWRIRPCIFIKDVKAYKGNVLGFLIVRTH